MLNPTIEYEMSKARIADLHRQAARTRIALAAGQGWRERKAAERTALGRVAMLTAGRLLPAARH